MARSDGAWLRRACVQNLTDSMRIWQHNPMESLHSYFNSLVGTAKEGAAATMYFVGAVVGAKYGFLGATALLCAAGASPWIGLPLAGAIAVSSGLTTARLMHLGTKQVLGEADGKHDVPPIHQRRLRHASRGLRSPA